MSRISLPEGWLTREASGWRAHVNIYVSDTANTNSEPDRVHRSEIIGELSLAKAEARILKNEWVKTQVGRHRGVRPDPRTTLTTFAENVYFPEVQGKWKEPTWVNRTYMTRHYILSRFGDRAIEDIGASELQLFLNELATRYCHGTIATILSLLSGLLQHARRRKYIDEDPTEELFLPRAKKPQKRWADDDQLAALFIAAEDLMDKCFLACAIFLALRSAELFGMQWKGFDFEKLTYTVGSTAYKAKLYEDNAKTDSSRQPVPLVDLIVPYILAWHRACPDPSLDALVFPRMPRQGVGKGNTVPWQSYQFINQRIRPLAKRLGIDPKLITSQVFRRSAIDALAVMESAKAAQGLGRHDSETTRKYYLRSVPRNVREAVRARTEGMIGSVPTNVQEEN
jgi:integrase